MIYLTKTLRHLLISLFFVIWLMPCAQASQLGAIIDVKSSKNDITINSEKGKIIITPINDNIIKVASVEKGERLNPLPSKSVVLSAKATFKVEKGSDAYMVKTANVEVSISRNNSIISFSAKGKQLLREDENRQIKEGDQIYSFKSNGGESFYGGGERGFSYDLKGDTLVMFNKQNYGYGKGDRTKQMNITIPFYISSLGYGVLFDDYATSKLILQNPVEYVSENKHPISYYFILGEDSNIASVVKNYTLLTGRQELAPFWSLGYITSKYGYKTQAETLGVIDALKRDGYPVDGIVLDLYWYGKETDMGRFQWNENQWPDHKKMLSTLKDEGVNTIIISQPYLNKIGAIDNYNMAKKNGYLTKDDSGNVHDVKTWVGEAGMLDVSNPKTRAWMWNQYKRLTDDGVSGWWGDLGEPEVHPLTIRHANGMKASEYHNVYGNDWSQIIYDGFKKEYPNTRLMTLMRGGTAGLQRFSVFPWSTDVSRSWGGLQAQVPIMLNTALSGMGYMSHDIGGFAVDSKHPTDDELYVRWLQLGLFTPIFRTHSTVDAEPYHYTKPGYQELLKSIVRDRYMWLPYNYTLAFENATIGAPLVRPLNFYDSQNPKLSNIQDQYFWGDEVMIAPVSEPNAIGREVIFPAGNWYDYGNSDITYQGPTTITYSAPLTVLPTFVRAGSFIPLATYPMQNTGDYKANDYTIKYFPADGKSSYTLYEDDRKSTSSIPNKEYKLLTFTADNTSQLLKIDMSQSGNGYANMPISREVTFEILALQSSPVGVTLDKTELVKSATKADLKTGSYFYDVKASTLWIKCSWASDLAELMIAK